VLESRAGELIAIEVKAAASVARRDIRPRSGCAMQSASVSEPESSSARAPKPLPRRRLWAVRSAVCGEGEVVVHRAARRRRRDRPLRGCPC